MIRQAAITFFLTGFLAFSAAADNVTLRFIDGYLIVRATLNGSHSRHFILDTGADVTVISPALAEQMGLEPNAYVEAGVAGGRTINVPLTSLQSISIGGRSVALETIVILDVTENMEGRLGDVAGVVGSDFLSNFISTIDYAGERLYFENPETLAQRLASGVKVPAEIEEESAIFVPVRLNGHLNRRYKLDTGAAVTHLTLNDAKLLGKNMETSGVSLGKSEGIAGSYDVLMFDLSDFEVGSAASVEDLAVKAYDTAYGFVGSDYLKHFKMTLNYDDLYIVLSMP